MKSIRKILIKLLGFKGYLKLVSIVYLGLVKKGFLKDKYPELFHLRQVIQPGFHCMDIGANLGYYSFFMSKYAGDTGRLYAIEPVPLYAEIWKTNMKNAPVNHELYNIALGEKEETTTMGIPVIDGVIRHGLSQVASGKIDYALEFKTTMKHGDRLFETIQQLDFIKCDVEGYEQFVFQSLKETIKKHKPLIQTELTGKENRQNVIQLLCGLGYKTKKLTDNKLAPLLEEEWGNYESDFYFVWE